MQIRQLFIDAYGCKGDLNNSATLLTAMEQAAVMAGARVVNRCRSEFQPHGVTAILILAESHIVVSTWPEHRYSAVDILLCGKGMDPLRAWKELRSALRPEREGEQWIMRSIGSLEGHDDRPSGRMDR